MTHTRSRRCHAAAARGHTVWCRTRGSTWRPCCMSASRSQAGNSSNLRSRYVFAACAWEAGQAAPRALPQKQGRHAACCNALSLLITACSSQVQRSSSKHGRHLPYVEGHVSCQGASRQGPAVHRRQGQPVKVQAGAREGTWERAPIAMAL